MSKLAGPLKGKTWRTSLSVLALGALMACDPAPQGDARCQSAFVCDYVEQIALNPRAGIGKDFGGGVVLRNTQALGQALVIDVTLPFTQAALKEPAGQRALGDFGRSLAGGFCAQPNTQEFFDLGATLRARGFSRDNVLVADQIIRSCGGIKR